MSSRHSIVYTVVFPCSVQGRYKTTINVAELTTEVCGLDRLPDRQELFTAANVPRFVGLTRLFAVTDITRNGG